MSGPFVLLEKQMYYVLLFRKYGIHIDLDTNIRLTRIKTDFALNTKSASHL